MSKDNYGIVYLLTNDAMPGLVKIGMTTRKDLDQRLKELYTTGVPVPFKCEYACKVPLTRTKELEEALHQAFEPNRINPNREFFKVSTRQILPLLKFANQGDDITEEVSEELENDLTAEDIAASNNLRSKRPVINYLEIGLHVGDKIRLIGHDAVAEIVDGRHVSFNGESVSLTALTKRLLNLTKAIQPSGRWETMEESPRNLNDLYETTYGTGEEE